MPTATPYVQVTGWCCVVLLIVLLYRAVVGKTVRLYPAFYSYAAFILISIVVGLSIRWPDDKGAYRIYYWASEAITTVMGVAVTWEIHRRILAHYPGVRRLAGMLLALTFAVVLLISAAGGADYGYSPVPVERDLRTVQAMVLLILFALVAYYGVRLGKNERGIAIGYVFGIATSVLNLSLRYYFGKPYQPIWALCRPIEFLAALTIWCVTLWCWQATPVPSNEDMERDYEWVSGQAVHAMVRLRTHLIHPDGS